MSEGIGVTETVRADVAGGATVATGYYKLAVLDLHIRIGGVNDDYAVVVG
jgi:hypothetical protein